MQHCRCLTCLSDRGFGFCERRQHSGLRNKALFSGLGEMHMKFSLIGQYARAIAVSQFGPFSVPI
jgi:hypothetical protein